MSPSLEIHLFGPPRVTLDGNPLKLDRRKTLALLACLAAGAQVVHPTGGRRLPRDNRGASREALATLLWPDCSQEQAASYLRQSLWDFSKAAGEGWVVREGGLIRLEETVLVDVEQFERCLAQWKSGGPDDPAGLACLSQAAVRYSGDFLAGFSLRDCPDFDQWQSLRAEGLRLDLGVVLQGLARLKSQQGAYEEALAHARRWLALDELNEAAQRELMRLYAESGQRAAALRQFEACQRVLQDELGVAPDAATVQLAQEISTHRPAARAPRPNGEAPLPIFLPNPSTPFLGRENELKRIQEMLDDPECRLVSLVGPGGSGKTRLAIQAAASAIGYPHRLRFPHGVYFAGLASAAGEGDAVPLIAGALQFEFHIDIGGSLPLSAARAQLLNYLSAKKCLLVLDNLEQMVGSAGLLAQILAAAPGAKLIVTTRERLNLTEEWVLEISGLDYPPALLASQPGDQTEITRYPAVQLFLKGAGRTAGFSPRAGDWPAIARIVQLLEGMPLGVELASAWVKLLSCQEIAEEIARSLDFLETSRPGLAERHRSLRAVFDYSWDLLAGHERDVLQRLAVFQGGFSREAAFAVADASLARLAALTDKSLVRRVSSGRFDLHELIKQFAAEKLAGAPAAWDETEERHARYYADLLHQKGEGLKGSRQLSSLAELRAEKHNLRRAWDWLVRRREDRQMLDLLPDLILFFEMDGDYATAKELMVRTADAARSSATEFSRPGSETAGSVTDELLALAQTGVRYFTRDPGDWEQAQPVMAESLALARRLPPGKTRATIYLLAGTGYCGLSPQESIPLGRQSAAMYQDAGDEWGQALALLILGDGLTVSRQDLEQASTCYRQSLEGFTRLGNDWGRGLCFFGLALVAGFSDRLEEAGQLMEQSLAIYLRLDNQSRVYDTREALGIIATELGKVEQARQLFLANLAHVEQTGDQARIAACQERLSRLDQRRELSSPPDVL